MSFGGEIVESPSQDGQDQKGTPSKKDTKTNLAANKEQ